MANANSPLRDWARHLHLYRALVPHGGHEIRDGCDIVDGQKKATEGEGRWLVERSADDMAHAVNPMASPRAHRAFARLTTEQDALRFANRYGLLGTGTRSVPMRQADGHGFIIGTRVAEPLATWFAESRRLRVLLALWDLLQRRAAGQLGQYVLWVGDTVIVRYAYRLDGRLELQSNPWPLDHWYQWQGTVSSGSGLLQLEHELLTQERLDAKRWRLRESADTISWVYGSPFGPMLYYITWSINHRLRGHVNATLLPPTCSLYFQPDSLLTALYALFALEISGESRPEPRCKECGRAITEGRADRQYCSPLCKTRWTERHRPRRHRGAGVGAAVRQRDG